MPQRDISLQILKLLSQQLVSLPDKIPEGKLFQLTSCMNPDDAETVGVLYAACDLMAEDPETQRDKEVTEDIAFIRSRLIPFLAKIGISKWVKGEITNLGLRVGTNYEQIVDVAKDEIVDEATVEKKLDERKKEKTNDTTSV